jgi:hypothetical protein
MDGRARLTAKQTYRAQMKKKKKKKIKLRGQNENTP